MEPNTSKVKWVLEKDLFASYAKVAEYQERDNIAAPVIALADLTELVEGLKQLADPFYGSSEELDEWERSKSKEPFNQWLAQRLLTQLEVRRKEGADGQ
jgi:hypothetical protein